MASPFQIKGTHENVVEPAVNGTQNILNSCLEHNVKKLVVTSSIAAIFCNQNFKNIFSEKDWADPKLHVKNTYKYSKIISEQLAWNFYSQLPENSKLELVSLNPGFIFGKYFFGF